MVETPHTIVIGNHSNGYDKESSRMNRNRIIFFTILSVIVICTVLFYRNTQEKASYEKAREMFEPIYAYSGKLTPEEQKSYFECVNSILKQAELLDPAKYKLPKREQLKLEVHTMTLLRNNPELILKLENIPMNIDQDVKLYQRYFGQLALIAKTKLSNLPKNNCSKIIDNLDSLNKRLVKNSIEVYVERLKDLPQTTSQQLREMAFGIQSINRRGETQPIFQEDGSMKMPETFKRGIVQITDIFDNEYTVDLDAPTKTLITENIDELYVKIDRLFEQLTDEELERLSTLSKAERSSTINKMFTLE